MALNFEQKQVIVSEVAEVAKKALSVVAADYRGLTVGEMNELRSKARATNVYVRVVQNRLAKRALEGTDFACINEQMVGPLMLAFSEAEPGAAARLIRDFRKTHDNLEVKMLSIGGKAMDASQLEALAKLPTRDEAIATLMRVMKAPIEKFVRTMAEPPAKLVRTFAAVRDSKQ